MKPIITLALSAAPMSIGMAYVVQALFPSMSGNTAGLVGGAVTFPVLVAIMGMGLDR